jgi:CheY-like chemotaxis protein
MEPRVPAVNKFVERQGSGHWGTPESLGGVPGWLGIAESSDRASVLVVDDDEAVRSSVGDILQAAGHIAIQVANGEAALRVLRTFRFDAMVLDLRMPGLDGFALLAALPQAPPVVTVSAFDLDHTAHHLVRSKAVRHLSKPLHPERLLDAVAHATRGRLSTDRIEG